MPTTPPEHILQVGPPLTDSKTPMKEDSYQALLVVEGPYDKPGMKMVNGVRTLDPGGETVFGRDMRSNPGWEGFDQAHTLLAHNIPPSEWNQNLLLMAMVRKAYQTDWDNWKIGLLPPLLQGPVFGGCVNEGPIVIKMLHECLLELHQLVTLDDGIGPQTVEAIARVELNVLRVFLKSRRDDAYLDIADKNPEEAEDLRGWLNRTRAGL